MTQRKRPRMPGRERRERILAAAVGVFAERGYDGAAMGEIARRAGIVPSVIYDHFASKRMLHVELLEQHGRRLIEHAIDRLELSGGPRERLEASVGAFFGFVEEDPFVWRFLFRDPPADAEIAAVHADIHRRATAGLTGLVAAGWPGAERPRAQEMLACAAQGATNGLAAWWYEHPEVPRDEVVALSAGLLWEGFAGLIAPDSGP